MAPTLVREPFHRDGWVYEEKVDGWRIVAYKDGQRVRLLIPTGATTRAGFTIWPPRSPSCRPGGRCTLSAVRIHLDLIESVYDLEKLPLELLLVVVCAIHIAQRPK